MRQAVMYALWMVAAAVVVGAVFNAARPGGIPFVGDWSAEAVTRIHAGGLEVIGPDEAYELFAAEKALFIDAREPGDYAGGHIPGSVNIPLEKAAEHLEDVRAMLRTGKTLIAYCYDVDCPLGADLVKDLRGQGVGPVRVMHEGWVGWLDRGYPHE